MLENEIFTENCLIILKNLNFFAEEVGYESNKLVDLVNSSKNNTSNHNITTNLKYNLKIFYLEKFMKGTIFLNDGRIFSF